MKAIVIRNEPGGQAVALTDIPRPVLGSPTEVVVRQLCVGLDGTDREMIAEKRGALPPGADQMVIGHESFGVVVEAGDQSGFHVGDPVTLLVRRPCIDPSCVNCRNGQQDFCLTGEFVERGLKHADGYLTEYVVEDARFVVKVPRRCADYGVLAEPQSIIEKVWNQVLRIQQRMVWQPQTALVIGSGPLGLLAALTCRSLGLRTHVWSMNEEQSVNADIVRQIGAVYHQAGGNKLQEAAGRWKERFDMVWECSGYPPIAFDAMGVLGPNGVLSLLSVSPFNRTLEIPADALNQEIVVQNKLIVGSVNASRKDFETGLYRLQQIEREYPGMLEALQSERLAMDQVPSLDFGSIRIKAVVDLVPRGEWRDWINPQRDIQYRFSI